MASEGHPFLIGAQFTAIWEKNQKYQPLNARNSCKALKPVTVCFINSLLRQLQKLSKKGKEIANVKMYSE